MNSGSPRFAGETTARSSSHQRSHGLAGLLHDSFGQPTPRPPQPHARAQLAHVSRIRRNRGFK